MGVFFLAVIGLIAATLLMLLRPWQGPSRADPDASMRQVNASVHRAQLAELDRDLAAGTIAAADHAIAREELQRRLLEDTAGATARDLGVGPGRHTLVALAIAIPLGASALYAALGAPGALVGAPAVASTPDGATAEIERMVAGLAARLEKNPGDMKGWEMLARSYHAMGRYPEAAAAFAKLGDTLHRDPLLLAVYADVLASSAGGNLQGEPLRLIQEALRLEPDHPMALSLAATEAYKRQDFAQAAVYWQRLLRQLPPESDEARWVQRTLAEIGGSPAAAASPASATAALGAPSAEGIPPAAPPAAVPSANASVGAVSGVVDLAPALQAGVRPEDTVFVFARATDGSRLPLAVQRARVADLPLKFRLDDSLAMSPEAKISAAREVRVEARISRGGSATPASGDLIGASGPVAPGETRVALTIDRVRE